MPIARCLSVRARVAGRFDWIEVFGEVCGWLLDGFANLVATG